MPESSVDADLVLSLTPAEANCVMQACNYWVSTANRKADRVRRMQVEAADKGRELTGAEEADVHYVNDELPRRVFNMGAVMGKITKASRERIPKPAG